MADSTGTPPSPTPYLIGLRDPARMHAELEAWLDSYIQALKQAECAPDKDEVSRLVSAIVKLCTDQPGHVAVVAVGGVFRMLLAYVKDNVKSTEVQVGVGSELVQ